MKDNLPDDQLSQMSEFVAARMGLHFPRERWRDLERQTKLAAQEFGFVDVDAFLQRLVSAPLTREQMDVLASHLTNSETYFWREPQVFEALRDQILPELIRSREKGDKRLRIWSAGCATGEEPYSIAIALRQALPVLRDWHITLLATDINHRILKRAEAGVYGAWSFRNAPPGLKEKNFRPTEAGKFKILPEIREMVTFSYLNLAEDIYPSPMNNTNAMDLIFCRNVLMYFEPERARQVGQNLYHSLVPGGWLMVSASELSQQLFPRFASVQFPGAIVYRKDTDKSRPLATFPLQPPPPQRNPVQPPLETAAVPGRVAPPPQPRPYERTRPAEAVETARKEASPPDAALAVRALANQGKLGEALAACEGAISADKLDPGLHYLCATILQEQNRGDEAIAAFNRALYLAPDFVLAHFALGNLARRQGNAAAARKHFKNALALLSAYGPEDSLPEGEGLTAGRLEEIIRATLQTGALT